MVSKKATNSLMTGAMAGVADGILVQPLLGRIGFAGDFGRVVLGLFSNKLPGGKTIKNIAMVEGIVGAFNLGQGFSGGGLFNGNGGGDF